MLENRDHELSGGAYTLSLSGDAGFRVWTTTPAVGEPLLVGGQTVTNGVGVTFLSGDDTDLFVEAVSNGTATLTYAFADSNISCSASLKMTAWDIEFVHAEGDDAGQPMDELPIFTPCSGTGKGVPIYDCPTADLTISFIATNAQCIRSATVTYLGTTNIVAETGQDSRVFTNASISISISDSLLADTNVLESLSVSVVAPSFGVTNAVYPCEETTADSSVFENAVYGLVFETGVPVATNRTASLRIVTTLLSDNFQLAETAPSANIFFGGGLSAQIREIAGRPYLSISDGGLLSNAVFSVWETAPQSYVYRNYNAPVLADLDEADLSVPNFAPWRLKIKGIGTASLLSHVSITTSVDSVSQVVFVADGGSLLSSQKYILIPDGELEVDPPEGYVPLRADALHSKWWNADQKDVSVIMTLAMASAEKAERKAKSQNGALVLESLDLDAAAHLFLWIGTKDRFKVPFETMEYTAMCDLHASANDTLSKHVKGKQLWYSLSHGATTTRTPQGTFQGLQFVDGGITAVQLEPLELDYRLVLADACCSAQTVVSSISDAAAASTLSPACSAFADSFGEHAAYVGWAWEMNPGNSQRWMGQFVQRLLYVGSLKRGRTVAEAYEKLRSDNIRLEKPYQLEMDLMKRYGATGNIVDLRKGK